LRPPLKETLAVATEISISRVGKAIRSALFDIHFGGICETTQICSAIIAMSLASAFAAYGQDVKVD
jgi:hypothetical protein